MKKIIVELLDQYEKDMDMPQFAVQYYTDEYIISKHYGFIKWLVENDKINIDKYREEYSENNLYCNSDFFKLLEYYDVYESLLMTLAIQDEPINLLIRVLK